MPRTGGGTGRGGLRWHRGGGVAYDYRDTRPDATRRMPRLILFHKPFEVLCQFTDAGGGGLRPRRRTLADFIPVRGVYAAGRLDFDSEGLVVLTDAGWLQHAVADPRHKLTKTYWVQVEGNPTAEALRRLETGVMLKDGLTRPARVNLLEPPPGVWPRHPPIRERKSIPTTWIAIALREGRNRQVRRMTAAVGFPTLRLIRLAIGPWEIRSLAPGAWREGFCPRDHRELQKLRELTPGLGP